MICIVNYGLGNLGSIQNMLKRLGYDSQISNDPSDLEKATKIILPGVGAFDTGMEDLNSNDWLPTLNKRVMEDKVPTLGICLGMQLMTNRSEEGQLPGLGWIKGEVVKFTDPSLRVPHMGWNIVTPTGDKSILLNEEETETRFYFVHSYFVKLDDPADQLGSTFYGSRFTSAFHRGNIYGVQFHPEKSHKFGMNLLRKFATL